MATKRAAGEGTSAASPSGGAPPSKAPKLTTQFEPVKIGMISTLVRHFNATDHEIITLVTSRATIKKNKTEALGAQISMNISVANTLGSSS